MWRAATASHLTHQQSTQSQTVLRPGSAAALRGGNCWLRVQLHACQAVGACTHGMGARAQGFLQFSWNSSKGAVYNVPGSWQSPARLALHAAALKRSHMQGTGLEALVPRHTQLRLHEPAIVLHFFLEQCCIESAQSCRVSSQYSPRLACPHSRGSACSSQRCC